MREGGIRQGSFQLSSRVTGALWLLTVAYLVKSASTIHRLFSIRRRKQAVFLRRRESRRRGIIDKYWLLGITKLENRSPEVFCAIYVDIKGSRGLWAQRVQLARPFRFKSEGWIMTGFSEYRVTRGALRDWFRFF